jgi:hypothetical protein
MSLDQAAFASMVLLTLGYIAFLLKEILAVLTDKKRTGGGR